MEDTLEFVNSRIVQPIMRLPDMIVAAEKRLTLIEYKFSDRAVTIYGSLADRTRNAWMLTDSDNWVS